MKSDRAPDTVLLLLLRDTGPLDLLAARSVILSLKVISLKGPLPRTVGRKRC